MSWLFDREVAQLSVLQEGEGSGAFRLRHPALTLARNLVALEHAYGFHLLAKVPPTKRKVLARAHVADACAAGLRGAWRRTIPGYVCQHRVALRLFRPLVRFSE